MYETLEHNIKIEKEKKDFLFFRLKMQVVGSSSHPSFSQT